MHRADGQSPEIDVSLDADALCIRVQDQGPALDGDALAALLEQPQTRPFDEGLGLRMLMARRIAEAHGGTLAAVQARAGALAMVCRLPAAAPRR
jgi:C4-dicarboxylate-specific signal transduction histidine kinase